MRLSGIGRAEAMAYRDTPGEGMTEHDWNMIEAQLLRAYQLLKVVVASGRNQQRANKKAPGDCRGF